MDFSPHEGGKQMRIDVCKDYKRSLVGKTGKRSKGRVDREKLFNSGPNRPKIE